ncbi:DNA-3-methyladenine glycosylase [Echria macrotheca]|uniref:DNA-3-methyladenine glycosylase n=1 Tax=Echria macrotheca TaxID=438768 RepID=A0AAJ0BEL6_9PEZI|nr:DNA-3-methyladenine glycosylase [Echria macrotheca]
MTTRRSARLSAIRETISESAGQTESRASSTASRKRKAVEEDRDSKSDEAPSTPTRRRRKNASGPPATPKLETPAFTSQLNGATPLQKPRAKAVDRLADPNRTNAPLFSPETSRIVASKPLDAVSPSKLRDANPTTTANILEEACAHLIKVDQRMKPLIDRHHCRIFSPEGLAEQVDPFEALASGIISQQVSGAAAKAIKARFVALFEDGLSEAAAAGGGGGGGGGGDASAGRRRFPQPSQVAATSIEKLRTAGLSQRKAEYLVGLAEKFASGELSAHLLADAPYEEVLEKLIAVRGLGKWSVEMFACFGLKRMDVFSLGDLGVQRGMAAFVGRDVAKLKGKGGKWKYMSEKEMEEISDRFRPYRSVFMWYMWRVEETDVSTME